MKQNETVAARFKKERDQLNEIVLKLAGKNLKRFYSLDSAVYRAGILPAKTKELMGLVSSLVLRCDDCILYHTIRCFEEGVSTGEFEETISIGLAVGGSITIPHIRRAMKNWQELTDFGLPDPE
ncbi:MAG: carboxymuconolactone decarboxylase family protein [Acidobacteria bacterium]|nr:carboxymuconolactone decarboxylase family protein [Acidobacteriota bacterium]